MYGWVRECELRTSDYRIGQYFFKISNIQLDREAVRTKNNGNMECPAEF